MVMIMATDRLCQTLNVGKLPLFEALGVRKIGAGLLVLGRVRLLKLLERAHHLGQGRKLAFIRRWRDR